MGLPASLCAGPDLSGATLKVFRDRAVLTMLQTLSVVEVAYPPLAIVHVTGVSDQGRKEWPVLPGPSTEDGTCEQCQGAVADERLQVPANAPDECSEAVSGGYVGAS